MYDAHIQKFKNRKNSKKIFITIQYILLGTNYFYLLASILSPNQKESIDLKFTQITKEKKKKRQ